MGARNGNTGASEVAVWEANPSCKAKALRGPNKSREAQAPSCQEKPLLFFMCPYRKPTQVDEERILKADGRSVVKELGKMTP